MRTAKVSFLRFLYAMIMGIMISAFSFGVSTVQAQEAQGNVAVAGEEAPLSESEDEESSAVFFLLGGMLIIIIAVVVTVVASVISTAPIADEV